MPMRGGDEDRLQRIIDKRLELLTLGDKHFLVQMVLHLNEETIRQAEEKHELQQRLEHKHERFNEYIASLRED